MAIDTKTEKPQGPLATWGRPREKMWVLGVVAILGGGGVMAGEPSINPSPLPSLTGRKFCNALRFLSSRPSSNPDPPEPWSVSGPICYAPSVSLSNLKISCFHESTSPSNPVLSQLHCTASLEGTGPEVPKGPPSVLGWARGRRQQPNG